MSAAATAPALTAGSPMAFPPRWLTHLQFLFQKNGWDGVVVLHFKDGALCDSEDYAVNEKPTRGAAVAAPTDGPFFPPALASAVGWYIRDGRTGSIAVTFARGVIVEWVRRVKKDLDRKRK